MSSLKPKRKRISDEWDLPNSIEHSPESSPDYPERRLLCELLKQGIHSARPSLRAIEAPDWIRQDDLFDLAIADGSLSAIGQIPAKEPKPVIEEPTQSIAQPMQPAAELTETDLELLNRPVSELTGKSAPAHWPTLGKSHFPSPESI